MTLVAFVKPSAAHTSRATHIFLDKEEGNLIKHAMVCLIEVGKLKLRRQKLCIYLLYCGFSGCNLLLLYSFDNLFCMN